MRKGTLLAMAIVLSCAGGLWAAVGDVYVGNSAGTYTCFTAGYTSSSDGPGVYSSIEGIAVQPNGKVTITSNTAGGIWLYDSGNPTSWNFEYYSAWYLGPMAGSMGKTVATSAGNVAWINADGAVRMLAGSLDSGWSYGVGYGNLTAIATLTGGKIAFGNSTGVVWTANGTTPFSGAAGAGGWGDVSSLTGLSNGNLAIGTPGGSIFITDPAVGYLAGAGGWGGGISAMAGLDNGKLAFGVGSTGSIFVTDALGNSLAGVGGWGTITQMAALPGGNFVVGNSAGSLYWLDSSLNVLHYEVGLGNITALAAQVPEPASLTLIALGLLGLRRKNRK